MFKWLKRWRQPDELRGLSAAERRARWEERDRAERAFLDKLEKKLAEGLPEQPPEAEAPSAPVPRSPSLSASAPPRMRERARPGRGSREPYFGEIERFPRLVRSRPDEAAPNADAVGAQKASAEATTDEMPTRPADRYAKIATELKSATLEPSPFSTVDESDAGGVLGLELVMRAALFAAERHKSQRLRAAARDPYINHLLEVAWLLADATDGADPDLVIAGLLHESIGDEAGTAEIARQFGENIAAVVAEVAEDKDAAAPERRQIELATIQTKSPRAQMIKMAELTSRVRTLRLSPPPDWSVERRREYLDWARQVVAACRGASERLAAAFDEACGDDRGPLRQAH